jgi:hypothetical protein
MSKIDREMQRARTPRLSSHVWRTAAATLRSYVTGRSAADMLKSMYPDDVVAPLLLSRAASTQAVLSDPAWAGPLAHYSVSDAIEEIVSMTALDRLARTGALQVDMGRNASVIVPGRIIDPTTAASMWIGEGQAVPVKQYDIIGPALNVHKIEVDVVVTRELSEASNIEDVLRMLLTEMAGLAIDAAVFSTAAASTQKSAGILHGLTALTGSTAGAGFDGCGADLGTLAADVASRGGGRVIAFIASPQQATQIRFWAGGQFDLVPGGDTTLPVASSAVLPTGTLIGIEPASLAYSFGAPTFSITKIAALQLDDAPANTAIMTSTPVKSMWQIDAMALRMTLWGDFCMRAPHVSFMQGVAW